MLALVPVLTTPGSSGNWNGLVPAPVTGETALAQGLTSFTVTGLSLPSVPVTVIYWLNPSSTDAPIGSQPSGTPTTDGFTVTFDTALTSANYTLVWLICFS